MSTEYQGRSGGDEVSGWAVGGMAFAATLMILIGFFHLIEGLVAIFDDDFFVVSKNYTFDLDTTAFGWIHLIIGLLVLGAGFSLLGRRAYGGVMVIFIAAFSAVANFFFIPYYPFWSILMIALAVWVIWSVTRPGAIQA
jgi:hypothetical protein